MPSKLTLWLGLCTQKIKKLNKSRTEITLIEKEKWKKLMKKNYSRRWEAHCIKSIEVVLVTLDQVFSPRLFEIVVCFASVRKIVKKLLWLTFNIQLLKYVYTHSNNKGRSFECIRRTHTDSVCFVLNQAVQQINSFHCLTN